MLKAARGSVRDGKCEVRISEHILSEDTSPDRNTEETVNSDKQRELKT